MCRLRAARSGTPGDAATRCARSPIRVVVGWGPAPAARHLIKSQAEESDRSLAPSHLLGCSREGADVPWGSASIPY